VAELEKMLDTRRRELGLAMKRRTVLEKRIRTLDRRIASLTGEDSRGTPRGGGRAQNASSLVETMETILRTAGKPLPVGDILERVQSTGYRSRSANFRALINQTLIKDKRFASADRGVYQLKK
jgi:hypothetical protein